MATMPPSRGEAPYEVWLCSGPSNLSRSSLHVPSGLGCQDAVKTAYTAGSYGNLDRYAPHQLTLFSTRMHPFSAKFSIMDLSTSRLCPFSFRLHPDWQRWLSNFSSIQDVFVKWKPFIMAKLPASCIIIAPVSVYKPQSTVWPCGPPQRVNAQATWAKPTS